MQSKLHRISRILGGLLVLTPGSFAQSFSFVSIDVPCGSAAPLSCPNGISRRTALGGINPAGDLVGVYMDGVGKSHGFVLKDAQFTSTDVPNVLALSGGEFITIDVPGSLVGVAGHLPSVARGINPAGDIVGQFTAPYNPPVSTTAPVDSATYCPAIGSAACIKGFLYRHGKFSPILFPGHPGAIPGAITPDGSIYGCLHDYDTMASMFSAGWIRSGDTFSYTSIATGGGALSDPNQSYPNSMHGGATPDGSVVTGFYVDMMTNQTHGYVLENGVLQTYDVPGSSSTTLWDINPEKTMVGTYTDSSAHPRQHGLLQLPDGSAPITVDAPSTAPFNAVRTVYQGINPAGAMTGQYTDTMGHTHGLLALPTAN
jgi:hypothetical protein